MTRTFPPGKSLSHQTNHKQNPCKYPPGLYLVATPIGNLGDITHRALEILSSVDHIACEDTRHSHILLQSYGIKTPTFSFHDHSTAQEKESLIHRIQEGKAIAYITDAGTPGISDPGYELVRDAIKAGIYVTHAPGPCAHIMALILSGLAPHPYYFQGFLPTKTKDREEILIRLQGLQATLIFYESPHRLATTLEDLYRHFGTRQGAIGRELTKVYETLHRGSLNELRDLVAHQPLKGECIVLVAPASAKAYQDEEIEALIQETLKHFPVSETAKKVSSLTGVSKKEIYKRALKYSKFL